MDRYEIDKELNTLYEELDVAKSADEQTVFLIFNTDSRDEIIQVIEDEIAYYKKQLDELEESERLEAEYDPHEYSYLLAQFVCDRSYRSPYPVDLH